jgi:hypothetical protein
MRRKSGIIPRVLISLLGIALILTGTGRVILGFAGESATARITDVRREGGERSDGRPGRYTYNIAYTFSLPDGRIIDGFTKRIGDAVYSKADGMSTAPVRYFSVFPLFNAPEEETGFRAGQIVLIAAGAFLVFVMNRKKKRS